MALLDTADEVLAELRSKGSEKTRVTYSRHGVDKDRALGVSIADLKVVAKAIKGRQELAYELYDSGWFEAMYLAGLVAKGAPMSRERLDAWAEAAVGMQMVSEYSVPFVAVENPLATELAVGWTRSSKEHVAAAGWCTYSGLLTVTADDRLDLDEIDRLLGFVLGNIGGAQNRTRYTMNGFVIAVGSYVTPLRARAKQVAEEIGPVSVDMGDTACKVRSASSTLAEMEAAGKIGVKRKTIRC